MLAHLPEASTAIYDMVFVFATAASSFHVGAAPNSVLLPTWCLMLALLPKASTAIDNLVFKVGAASDLVFKVGAASESVHCN